ncbi:hypothetical protein TNCV_4983741 [Trichonephila clavipes]|nr:hypothetical protein TNCV_4983741 [Trichonephila clavipes]
MELVILNGGHLMKTTPELAPPLQNTTPIGGFRVTTDLTCISRSTWRVFSSTRTRDHDTLTIATRLPHRNYSTVKYTTTSRLAPGF